MKELDLKNYKKVIPMLQSADINTMFALFVLEGKVEGKVFIDDEDSPSSFYIRHPYGMSLLYGETKKEDFYAELTNYMLNLEHARNTYEWLQVYPASLFSKMYDIFGSNLIKKKPNEPYLLLPEEEKKVLEFQRVNFIFNKDKYLIFKRNLNNKDYPIVPTSETIFDKLNGSVVPKYFWNNAKDFIKNGKGFTLLLENNVPASTAFASYIIEDKLEIGIETCNKYQGTGFASLVCAELIDYSLANGYEPVWSCNSANLGSRKLAQKLGFDEVKRIPYYRLPK